MRRARPQKVFLSIASFRGLAACSHLPLSLRVSQVERLERPLQNNSSTPFQVNNYSGSHKAKEPYAANTQILTVMIDSSNEATVTQQQDLVLGVGVVFCVWLVRPKRRCDQC